MRTGAHSLPDNGRAAEAATAATAATLNYALGNLGHRQKPWMVSSASPSTAPTFPPSERIAAPPPSHLVERGRPRGPPRSLALPTHDQQTTLRATPSHRPQAGKQPASSPTSPQLANVVTSQDEPPHRNSAVTVFPSPTPSDDSTSHATTPNPCPDSNTEPPNQDTSGVEKDHANNPSELSPDILYIESVGHADYAPTRAAEGHGRRAGKRKRVHVSEQEQPSHLTVTMNRPSPTNPPCYEVPRRLPNSHIQSGSQPLGRAYNLPVNHSDGQMPSPPGPPRSLSRGAAQHPFSLPTEPARSAAPGLGRIVQQSTASNSNWYTMEQCLQVFYGFRASYTASSRNPADLRRMEVLRDATIKHDWSYLIMHQYYCLSSHSPNALPQILRQQPNSRQAQQMMRGVLGINDDLSPAVLEFFVSYPLRMDQIATNWPQGFEREAQLLLCFIRHSTSYDQLAFVCERRRCPPIVQELVELGVSSPTFQRLLFTAFFRRLWQAIPPQRQLQKQFEDLAIAVFVQNQTELLQHETVVAQSLILGMRIPQLDKERGLYRWTSKLVQLAERFKSALQAQGHSLTNAPDGRESQLHAQPYIGSQMIQQQPQRVLQSNNPLVTRPSEMRRHSGLTNAQLASGAVQQMHEGRLHQPLSQPPLRQQTQPSSIPLLPHRGWIQPQQRQPNPARYGLHQADLRSPVLQAQDLGSPLYHYVYAFSIRPTRLSDAGQAVERWTFPLSQSGVQDIPKRVPNAFGTPEARHVMEAEKTRTMRLRCVKWPSNDKLSMHDWAITDTNWIPHSYFKLNGLSLQQRKKVHYGKDLPIDITGFLCEGENVLESTVMAMSNDKSYLQYLVAIEVLSVMTHESIKQRCVDNAVSAADTIETIRNKLSVTNEASNDDDISIVENNLTINIFDPFSASKICDIPVRSTACLHIDCFDLETFLQTRRRKGDASVTDQWRCPICNADARPSELIVDSFLVEVKEALETQGLAQTRAIVVDQDGKWKPKKEVRDPNGVQDRDTPEATGMPAVAKPAVPAIMEVIDLSD